MQIHCRRRASVPDLPRFGIMQKLPHDRRRRQRTAYGKNAHERRGKGEREQIGAAHAVEPPGTVIVSQYGLKALTDAERDGKGKHKHLLHHPHRRQCSVAVLLDRPIEENGAKACENLPAEGGKARGDHLAVNARAAGNTLKAQAGDAAARKEHKQQNEKADDLAEAGGQPRRRRSPYESR